MINIIVAFSENNVIGNKGKLPWYIPADLKRFKQLTMGHPVIMGRKTLDSIGRPLPGRTNLIITTKFGLNYAECNPFSNVDQALKYALKLDKEIFIIGGAQIYKQTIDLADRIYLTKIHESFEGDAFFPELNLKEWTLDFEEFFTDNINYSFIELIKH